MSSILVVEDIHSIRLAVKELLESSYTVFDAPNFQEAVKILESERIDLVISDIRMPGKSGLELIKYIQQNFPETLYALMTAYNINHYIHFAKNHNVWNIIPKYSFLDMRFIEVMVKKLLTKNILGIEKYFPNAIIDESNWNSPFEEAKPNTIHFRKICSAKDRNIYTGKISKFFRNHGAPNSIQQVLEELTSNAMIRAPKDEDGNYKYQFEIPSKDLVVPVENIHLEEGDAFDIGYGILDNIFIIVVRDYFGALKKDEILRRLDRQISISDETGFPLGISDSHGRGLYICREISDQLIFNIQKNKCTELISLIDIDKKGEFKSLSIYEA